MTKNKFGRSITGVTMSKGSFYIAPRFCAMIMNNIYLSEGFALMGYVVPGCGEDGAGMVWGNSSAAAVLARSFLDIC